MTTAIVLPLLVPLATAAACFLFARWPRLQRALSLAGALAGSGAAVNLLVRVLEEGVQVTRVGGWTPPFAIALVADPLSALLLTLPGVLGAAILVHATLAREEGIEHPYTHPIVHVLLFGVAGAFLAGDVFNLYVWFEVLMISSFVLIGLHARQSGIAGAIHYVVPNLLCSALLLAGIGLLYGSTGTLDMTRLHAVLAEGDRAVAAPLAALFLVAFGIKAALFPFSGWLPRSYSTAPPWIAALFSALLTKVGLYSLLRTFTLVFARGEAWSPDVVLALALLSMSLGVLGAAAQNDQRRILAFHSVSQIGYVAFGLAIGTPLALAGSILFIVHHALVKSNLFLVCGLTGRLAGTFRLPDAGGVLGRAPLTATAFGVSAMSLAGLPPFSGFVAKLALVAAALADGRHAAAAAALGVSLITTFSMTKVWSEVFWKPPPEGAGERSREALSWTAVVIPMLLAVATLTLGLAGGPVLEVAKNAAAGLLEPANYVLGEGGQHP